MEIVTVVSGGWTARCAFYRVGTGEKKRAPPRDARRDFLRRANLFDELQEDHDEPDDGDEPREGPQPREPRETDSRVSDPTPEEELCAEKGRLVRLARRDRNQHQRG